MGITALFGSGAMRDSVNAFQKKVEAATIVALQQLGEGLTAYAKDQHNYTDRTGNLTNSIGYVVVHKGAILSTGGFGGEGVGPSLAIAMKMVNTVGNSFSLIIIAGMNYAAYVEAKGYNVILPAELKARTDFPATMNKLVSAARLKAQQLYVNI